MKNTIHFTLNKSLNRNSLVGASTGEAISADRLNYAESMELQPFTPGLNISKSRKETNSAGGYRYVRACHRRRSRNSCCTRFQRSGDFPPVEKPIDRHVSRDTLPCQLHTCTIVKTSGGWTPQQVLAAARHSSCFHDDNGHSCQSGGIYEPLSGLGLVALY